MCGIAGEFRYRRGGVAEADWEGLSSMMRRRGPDDSGFWSDSQGCNLAFRRLAIIDLSQNGHQPMTACEGRYVLVFNGEVYNFADLRTELEGLGWRFRSTSDTEVVLHALIEWGTEALRRFNGMFAIGFYDRSERRLLLARDHAGIKPLYYLHRPEGVVFASQYDQILAHPLSENLGVSLDALALYLRLAYIPAPYALLRDTHMLEPGRWVRFDGQGKVEHGTFFKFPTDDPPELRGDAALEALDQAITNAVRRQLVSDVPVGAFLSGGIDSPLVVAKMQSVNPSPVRAFTIGTDEPATDETEDARVYAGEFGVEHIVERLAPADVMGRLDDAIDSCGEPFGDYSIFPTLLVCRLAADRGFKVLLSGDGGDELFWGYPGRFGPLIRAAPGFLRPRGYRQAARLWGRLLRRNTDGAYSGHRSLGNWHRQMLTHLAESRLRRIFRSLPPWPAAYPVFDYRAVDPDQAARHSRHVEWSAHLPYVLNKVDRASMFHSLEVRVPLLDLEVVSTAGRIDWRDCLDLDRRVGKQVLRRLLMRHTRHQVKHKRGFEAPMGAWLRTSLREQFEETVLQRRDFLGLEINPKGLRGLFDEHQSGRANHAWGLWPILSLGLWIDRHYGKPKLLRR